MPVAVKRGRGRPPGTKGPTAPSRNGPTRKKAKLLKDTIGKVEDYKDELERQIMSGTELAVTLDDETAEAHNLYLFGKNGRRPVKDLDTLSRMTGVPRTRLDVLVPVWRREAMRLAREASPLFAMAASAVARADHHRDLEKMRKRIEEFEAALPSTKSETFPAKYRMLMLMRKEWQDAAGVTAAIEISKACVMMEAKTLLTEVRGDDGDGEDDLSAFDIDV